MNVNTWTDTGADPVTRARMRSSPKAACTRQTVQESVKHPIQQRGHKIRGEEGGGGGVNIGSLVGMFNFRPSVRPFDGIVLEV